MENKEDTEKDQNESNVDRLLYLENQRDIVERAIHLTEKSKQIKEFQIDVIKLHHEKWMKMDNSVESMQEDINWYVKEYIMPMKEKQQELDKLENSLISIPENQSIIGKVGKFFERFIPGITREGRQRRKIADKKQTIEEEIESYKIMIDKNPFKIVGANKEIKGQLLERVDVNQLDKYSTMQNDSNNYLKPNNSVKSIADSIKREDMIILLDSYPELKEESNYLINECINNGIEGLDNVAVQIKQEKNELIEGIDLSNNRKNILDRITQQIQSIMTNITPEELNEINRIKKQKELEHENYDGEQK